jgi:hypothetical protein
VVISDQHANRFHLMDAMPAPLGLSRVK